MRVSKKVAISCSQPAAKPGLRTLPADIFSNLIEIRIGQAKDHLRSGEYWRAINMCTSVIDDTLSSTRQRMEAYLVRGKALFFASIHLPAAAYDFYKVLQIDNDNREAFRYIKKIEEATGLPLTKK